MSHKPASTTDPSAVWISHNPCSCMPFITHMNPAPPVIMMFFTSGDGSNLVLPVRIGASFQMPKSSKNLFASPFKESLGAIEHVLVRISFLLCSLHGTLGLRRQEYGRGINVLGGSRGSLLLILRFMLNDMVKDEGVYGNDDEKDETSVIVTIFKLRNLKRKTRSPGSKS